MQALDSVFAQELPADEVIVVDDGSTDNGPEIVRQYATTHPLLFLCKSNGGQSSARNFGIRHAKGTLIALLDQDDSWYPHHLRELVRPFREESHRTIGWTYSNLDEIGSDGKLRARSVLNASKVDHPKVDLANCLMQDMFILPSASLLLREAIEAVGYFDERLSGYEDDDLFVRLFVAGYHNVYIEEALGQWRVYPSSSSFSSRMAISRMTYARKLIESFPDQPVFDRHYSSEILARRFLKQVVQEASNALSRGDVATADMCMDDIAFLEHTIAVVPPPYPLREQLLVTAVVLLRNGAATIRAGLESVQRQSRRVDEIIVVDDGSTDDGPRIVQEMAADRRIRLLRPAPGSVAAARNAGVRAAHGDFVAFLDQGDRWLFNHVAMLLDPFRKKRPVELGWVCGDVAEIDADGTTARRHRTIADEVPQPKGTLADCLGHDMLVLPSATMVSRKAYWAEDGCDEQLDACEDDDLFLRLFRAGYENVHVGHAVAAWRAQRSMCAGRSQVVQGLSRFVRKSIEQCLPDRAQGAELRIRTVQRFLIRFVQEARAALQLGDAATAALCREQILDLQRIAAPEGPHGLVRKDRIVSAVSPLCNGAATISQALDSALRQSRQIDEIVVVDYGSTDNGPDLVRRTAHDPRVRLISHPCTSKAAARNIGVEHASGEVIAFLDTDQIWYAHHVERLLRPFCSSRQTPLGWSYATVDEIGADGSMLVKNYLGGLPGEHPKHSLPDCLRHDMNVFPSAALISRQAYKAAGGCDERLSSFEDEDLFLRLFQAGFDNDYVNEPLSGWCRQWSPLITNAALAASRMTYLRKLIERFANARQQRGDYVRDLIAPRFFLGALTDMRRAILLGTPEQRTQAVDNLRFVVRNLPDGRRILLTTLVLPLLSSPVTARLIMQYRSTLFRLFGRTLRL